jgi:DNA repair exonuclease SbcCD ATPase subunit
MSDRRQPDLSTGQQTAYRGGGAAPRKRKQPASGGGRSIGTNLVVALLVVGLMLAGWFIANQQQMLIKEQARVSAAGDRLAKLEARLSATDSALSQGGEDTQEQLGVWESEIRKLWAVSNERNKKWIEENKTNISNLQKALNGVEATSRDLRAAVGRHDAAFEQQQALVDHITSVELQLQQVARGQRDLVDKVNSATQMVSSLRTSLAGKVDDNLEAIQSMDAYRVAVNSRLSDIERRLSALSATGG